MYYLDSLNEKIDERGLDTNSIFEELVELEKIRTEFRNQVG